MKYRPASYPLISCIFNEGQVQYVVDEQSPTLFAGGTAGTGNTTIDGSLVGEFPHIGGFAFSTTNGLVFWTSESGNIYRSDAQFVYSQLIVESTTQPLDIEVDTEGGRIYWLDQASRAIMGANLDGTDIETVQRVGSDAVEFVLDKQNERFFTLGSGEPSSIVQYFYTQTHATEAEERQGELVYTSDSSLNALALDNKDDVLYWAEAGGSASARIASIQTQPSGTDPQVPDVQLVVNDPTVVDSPSSLSIIDNADQVFWAEPDRQELARFDENAAPSTLTHVYSASPVPPQLVEYDSLNDRLLVVGQDLSVYQINSEFEESGLVGTVPEVIDDLAYARIEEITDTPPTDTPPDDSLTVAQNTGLNLGKGESMLLSAADLSVTGEEYSGKHH